MIRIFTLIFLVCLPAFSHSQINSSADTPEPGSVDAIAKATTDPHYNSPWVSYLPESKTVPSPLKFFGRIMGAPGEFVDSAKAYAYCKALAASPRVRVFTIGRSEEGRDIQMLAIADEAGIRDLDRLKAATAALADPRQTDEAAAEKLITNARPIYYWNAALHSDETGSTEATLEMAYRLAVSEQPAIKRIREQLVVLINPVSNPDGRDKVVEWFYRYLKGKTDRASMPRMSPPYWSKYAFVDINRDAHQLTHETTKAANRMFFEWHPTIVHDMHEGMPMLMSWNGTGPYNPAIDPITYSEFLDMSFHEVGNMTALGMPGVQTWNFGEAFSMIYMDSVAMNHNSTGRGYETWGNGSAETMMRDVAPSEMTREWYRPLPPEKDEILWSARDNVNYQETAALISLDYVAQNSKSFLQNFYEKGIHSYRKGVEEAPYAFLIPADQGDRLRVAQMVSLLLKQHIEVSKAKAAIKVKEGEFPAGTYVVRLDQPYRNYAVDLLMPQQYPKDGNQPYDDVSWELAANYKLTAVPTADVSIRTVALDAMREMPHPAGSVTGTGSVFLLKDTGQESLLAVRYRLAKFNLQIAEKNFEANGEKYPKGSWIFPAQSGLDDALHSVANDFGLDFMSVAAVPDVAKHDAKPPRIGVWVPWADTDSIGWVRYSLDQRQMPYMYVRDEDIRAGNLRDKIDVLLYGHVDLELAEQIVGLPKAWGPMPYKKTPQTPSFGTPAETDDITGGIGYEGLAKIQHFVDDGGLMVTLGSGTMLALEGGIVRGVRRFSGGVPRSTQGGGADAAQRDKTPKRARPERMCVRVLKSGFSHSLWVSTEDLRVSSKFSAVRPSTGMAAYGVLHHMSRWPGTIAAAVVMEWGSSDGSPILVSGQVWGENNLIGRPAILDMPKEKGMW